MRQAAGALLKHLGTSRPWQPLFLFQVSFVPTPLDCGCLSTCKVSSDPQQPLDVIHLLRTGENRCPVLRVVAVWASVFPTVKRMDGVPHISSPRHHRLLKKRLVALCKLKVRPYCSWRHHLRMLLKMEKWSRCPATSVTHTN